MNNSANDFLPWHSRQPFAKQQIQQLRQHHCPLLINKQHSQPVQRLLSIDEQYTTFNQNEDSLNNNSCFIKTGQHTCNIGSLGAVQSKNMAFFHKYDRFRGEAQLLDNDQKPFKSLSYMQITKIQPQNIAVPQYNTKKIPKVVSSIIKSKDKLCSDLGVNKTNEQRWVTFENEMIRVAQSGWCCKKVSFSYFIEQKRKKQLSSKFNSAEISRKQVNRRGTTEMHNSMDTIDSITPNQALIINRQKQHQKIVPQTIHNNRQDKPKQKNRALSKSQKNSKKKNLGQCQLQNIKIVKLLQMAN